MYNPSPHHPSSVSAVFTPKVIGVAIARYDFSSRDTRELSLQEGDVVKIYTKSGANGWWRGEVNGRVSERLQMPIKHSLQSMVAYFGSSHFIHLKSLKKS